MCRSVQPVKQQQFGTRKEKKNLPSTSRRLRRFGFPDMETLRLFTLPLNMLFFGSGCFSKKMIDLSGEDTVAWPLSIEESNLELIPRRHRSTNDGNEAVLGLQRIAIANLSQTCPPFVRSHSFSFSFQQQQRRRHRCVGLKRKSNSIEKIFRIIR